MKIPDSIKIGYKTYKIVFADNELCENGTTYGLINYTNQTITLNKDNTDEQNEAILLHEILHGIEDICDTELGEHVVTLLTNALYGVYKDNFKKG